MFLGGRWEFRLGKVFQTHCEHVLTSRVLFVALMCCYQNTKTLSSVLGKEVHPGNIIYGRET